MIHAAFYRSEGSHILEAKNLSRPSLPPSYWLIHHRLIDHWKCTNNISMGTVSTNTQMEETTTACVVARPTPCVPPVVFMP